MIVYFEFEERRRKADVQWPKNGGNIVVHLNDNELLKDMPGDLYFEIDRRNKVVFTLENPADKRLSGLQSTLSRRLQEFANQS